MAEVAYKPLGAINPSNADYKTIFQVPEYDDVGVSYKGYSKTKISGTNYQLNPQFQRRISFLLNNVSAGSNLGNRPSYETKIFYVTEILIHWKLASGIFPSTFIISDVNALGGALPKFYTYMFATGEEHFFYRFAVPLKFEGKYFDFYTQMSLGASDYVQIQLFGWEE